MNTISKNDDGSFTIAPRKPGLEAAAVGGGFAPDFNGDQSFAGLEGGVEVVSGGLVSYAIFSAVYATLDTIPLVRSGQITRGQQREIIFDRIWESTKAGVPVVLIVGGVLAVCPWLAPLATLCGVIGGAVAITRITKAAWSALSEEQRTTLRQKATEVGVTVPGLSDAEPSSA